MGLWQLADGERLLRLHAGAYREFWFAPDEASAVRQSEAEWYRGFCRPCVFPSGRMRVFCFLGESQGAEKGASE